MQLTIATRRPSPWSGLEIAGRQHRRRPRCANGASGELAASRGRRRCPTAPSTTARSPTRRPSPTALQRPLRRPTSSRKRVRLGIANQRVVVRTLRLPAIDDPASSRPRSASRPRSRSRCRSTRRCSTTGSSAASPATEESAPTDRRDPRRRPPRNDRRVAGPAARGRPAAGRHRPLGLRPDPGPRRGRADRDRAREEGEPRPGPTARPSTATSATRPTSPSPSGRSCLFTRVAPVGLGDFAETSRPRPA